MISESLKRADQSGAIADAAALLKRAGSLSHTYECSFVHSDDFGGKPAAFVDIFPVGPDLAKDHKKFGGIFVRLWSFGEPRTLTYGLVLGAERAEQNEPRRGVAYTRARLGKSLVEFEAASAFGYHTWTNANFQWGTKSTRSPARQLEQFISFRQDSPTSKDAAQIDIRIIQAITFLDGALRRLKPIAGFGQTIIREYYSENFPDPQILDVSNGPDMQTLALLPNRFQTALKQVHLTVDDKTILRFVAALLSKRFLILTGLSGSGKTKLAQAFARWITPPDADCFSVVPVGADWTSNEQIIGYPDNLHDGYFQQSTLRLILRAQASWDRGERIPHILILDEMNLSHVERYFSDLLSIIESGDQIALHHDDPVKRGVPQRLALPENFFVVGTVNVDETTYMFSPKVLDRANVLEFRVEAQEMREFLEMPLAVDLNKLAEPGVNGTAFGKDFVNASTTAYNIKPTADEQKQIQSELMLFFRALEEHNAEFGFRVGKEIARFIYFHKILNGGTSDFRNAMDAQIVQKILPKLNGSRNKLTGVLWTLAALCQEDYAWRSKLDEKECTAGLETLLKEVSEAVETGGEKFDPSIASANLEAKHKVPHYPLSFKKITRMWHTLEANGFVSFTEA